MWQVTGHYPYLVEADSEQEAVEKACDKIGNGWEWQAAQVATVRSESLLADLDRFRARCAEKEYTDTGEAWEMIDKLAEGVEETLTIAEILSGLSQVRADIAADENAARGEGFDGIAHAYATSGARLDGAIRGIQSRASSRVFPPERTES